MADGKCVFFALFFLFFLFFNSNASYNMPLTTPLIDSSLLSGKQILISGNTKGSVVFRGQVGGSAFLNWASSALWSPTALTLQNLVFANGQSVSGANFLSLQGSSSTNLAFGSLTMQDCAFQNIRVNGLSSAGLLNFGTGVIVNVLITDSVFSDIAPVTSGGLGSAISWGPVR